MTDQELMWEVLKLPDDLHGLLHATLTKNDFQGTTHMVRVLPDGMATAELAGFLYELSPPHDPNTMLPNKRFIQFLDVDETKDWVGFKVWEPDVPFMMQFKPIVVSPNCNIM